ncbi:aspartyl-phosphate phosphatase Spo0E family protein [Brassicibacter mesophilus]|uniref:aspartyl-phosphate phosphatase Spo0E family protein n=1 Tax=Brassicibacter mesophilus TaxID=745119 RepID=UPI003D21E232
MTRKEQLQLEIESRKEDLNRKIIDNNVSKDKILSLSQELDELIVQYTKIEFDIFL